MKYSIFIVTLFVLVYGNLLSQTFTRIDSGDVVSDMSWQNAWGDYDNDGYLDLFANHADTSHLYNNNGDGTFTRINQGTLATEGFGSGPIWGDYDNDSYLDLFTASGYDVFGGDSTALLFHNNGDGTFTKIIFPDTSDFNQSSWGDYDNDGYLDLFVPCGINTLSGLDNFLYHNEGDGTFARITTGNIVNDGGLSVGCSWCDYDNDGYLDLFVRNTDGENNFLYHNDGDGTFSKITQGVIVNDGGDGGSNCWGDYDNDGDLDLFVGNYLGEVNFLYQNDGPPDYTFTKITAGSIVNDTSWTLGSTWGDYDNDGDIDLFVSNAIFQNNFLYSNNGNGTFTKIVSGAIVNDPWGWSIGTSSADYDNDGDLDIFVSNVAVTNWLYANDGNLNSWVNVKCIGTVSNYSGIGTKVRIKANIFGTDVWQLREISGEGQNSLNVEFGLGDVTVIDSIIIEWPSGIIETYTSIGVNQFITATENGGITGIDENSFNLPNQFQLYQNYPNPFNPNTLVKYQIPELSFVTLKVYDVLGNEIATLVNGEKPVGSYQIEFDATILSSGIYFYRLQAVPTGRQAGNFVETKKMVLLK